MSGTFATLQKINKNKTTKITQEITMKGFACIDALHASMSTVDENMPLTSEQGSAVKCGHLSLILGSDKHLPVYVKVYWSGFEPFAVVYRDKKFCNASAFIRVKKCVVTKDTENSQRFVIIPNNSEGCTIVFEAHSERECEEWVRVLARSVHKNSRCCLAKLSVVPELVSQIPKSPVMPTLKEHDEDEDV